MSIDPTSSAATIGSMVAKYTATVIDGQLVLDEPTELPDGTKVEISVAWSEDQLSPEERQALVASLKRGLAQAARGEGISREEMRARLMAKRRA